MKLVRNITIIFLMFFSIPSQSIDHIRYEKGQSALDIRGNYKQELLRLALERTVADYGDYKITTEAPRMNAIRARKEIQKGELLNVYIAVANPDWEKEAIAIKIPVRKGLLNYRLLLIHEDDLPLFAEIKTIDELKKLTVGLLTDWSTTKIMSRQAFTIVAGNNYDGIFKMLDSHRFEFLPRGVNEIFGELEQRDDILNHVIIEPNLVLHIPSPTYIFVSPNYPHIAKRLQEGFEMIIKDGSFDALFHQYFDEYITRANLSKRRILRLDNAYAPSEIPLERAELWFTP